MKLQVNQSLLYLSLFENRRAIIKSISNVDYIFIFLIGTIIEKHFSCYLYVNYIRNNTYYTLTLVTTILYVLFLN